MKYPTWASQANKQAFCLVQRATTITLQNQSLFDCTKTVQELRIEADPTTINNKVYNLK